MHFACFIAFRQRLAPLVLGAFFTLSCSPLHRSPISLFSTGAAVSCKTCSETNRVREEVNLRNGVFGSKLINNFYGILPCTVRLPSSTTEIVRTVFFRPHHDYINIYFRHLFPPFIERKRYRQRRSLFSRVDKFPLMRSSKSAKMGEFRRGFRIPFVLLMEAS